MALRRFVVFTLMILLIAAAPVWAVTNEIPDLPRISGAVKIDGSLDDLAWRKALKIDVNIETNPGENVPAKVKTVAYLMEDGVNLYIAFDARDPNPKAIRAFLRDRDSAYNDDFVGVVIDSYNDERRAFEFFSNPLGAQMDLTNDDVNHREDDSWNAIWDSAGKITESGYIVEMEIPLNQLRFPAADGKQTWGIDVLRMYPRDSRTRIGATPLDREVNCYLCQVGKIRGFENVEPGRDLEIVPTVTASKNDTLDDPLVDSLQSGDMEAEAGLSIRWGITPDMTANLAINPDFSQIEADVAQLDVNNQFALFFPETRPFFLEGSDYFSTPIQAVFTRTVADPALGAKLTGKRGKNTYGAFATEDEITNLIFPGAFGSDSESLDISNTAFVGRYSRSFGEASSIGALMTARSGDSYHNYVGGLDARWKIDDHHELKAQVLKSDTEYPDQVADDFDQPTDAFTGNAAQAEYNYNSRNWFAYARHEMRDKGFRADSGFVTRVDYDQQTLGLGHIWHGEEDDWWTRMRLNGDYDIAHDDQGRLLEKEIEGYFGINGPLQSYLEFGGLSRDVLFNDVLFHENKISLYTEMKPRGGLYFGIWARVGDQIDFDNTVLGDEIRLQPRVEWNANQNLLLRLQSSLVRLDSKEGPNIFDAQVHDLRATWQFSVRSFIRLSVQYQDVERNQDMYIDQVDAHTRDVGRQLLYSYKLNPQTVFFLGYSDGHVDEDDLESLTITDRTLFMKIGYAWMP
ncbi:MAG: hypothetical protein DRR11_00515 [Gammaproteobacteria bacterium]|nr:MAG: hypothetical protein DRR11_00515 [Gammaproteobacteria bacterium]